MTSPLDEYCATCAAGPQTPCVDPLTGVPCETHESRVRLAKSKG